MLLESASDFERFAPCYNTGMSDEWEIYRVVQLLSAIVFLLLLSGFGPDIKTPGGSLRHSLEVVENQIYFLQVWSQATTAGKYSLMVE